MVTTTVAQPPVPWQPRGAASLLYKLADTEVVLSGPAGTGKSRGCLQYLHDWCRLLPGVRVLIVRKTLTSLTGTGLVTYREKVLEPSDRVKFFGGSRDRPAAYQYPNGSTIVVGGMDKATKVMSAEYDLIYVQEATELTEGEWEALTTRLRNGRTPIQQLIADCNPEGPRHWLKLRADAGKLRMLESRHEDNPSVTPAYLSKLDALTGVRYLRLRLGLWAAAEGMVYDDWDRNVHLVDRFDPPGVWPRYWVVDFGYTNPFVWQEWAEDNDGRLYRVREIYHTQRLVEDHAADILKVTANAPRPVAIICDHDAEDRATLERYLDMPTIGARKSVSDGIQAVASRLRPAGDGRPRLLLMRDALVERDTALDDAKKPASTEDEVEGYVWDTGAGKKPKDAPLKKDDHGMDAMRYLVAHVDGLGGTNGATTQTDRYGREIG